MKKIYLHTPCFVNCYQFLVDGEVVYEYRNSYIWDHRTKTHAVHAFVAFCKRKGLQHDVGEWVPGFATPSNVKLSHQ